MCQPSRVKIGSATRQKDEGRCVCHFIEVLTKNTFCEESNLKLSDPRFVVRFKDRKVQAKFLFLRYFLNCLRFSIEIFVVSKTAKLCIFLLHA